MWNKFKKEGVEAMVDKRWGAEPRKRTSEKEAEVLRAKALDPEKGDRLVIPSEEDEGKKKALKLK